MGRTAIAEYQVFKSKKPNGKKQWFILGRPNGKPIRQWFSSKELAGAEATKRNAQLRRVGSVAGAADPAFIDMASKLEEMLRGYGMTLQQAAELARADRESHTASKPIDVFIESVLAKKQSQVAERLEHGEGGFKPRSLERLTSACRKITARFGSTLLSKITTAEIESWLLNELPTLGQRARNQQYKYTKQIFNAAKKDGLITANPVDRIDAKLFKIDRAEPKIITPEQFERLLKVACDETKPLFALSGLAGIRWSEIEGLRWSDIHADTIVISREVSKTNKSRVVDIVPALAAFLAPYRDRTGSILPRVGKDQHPSINRLNQNLRPKAEKAAGIASWDQNCLRHSFISYLLVVTENINAVAYQAGNSPEIIERDYKALIPGAKPYASKWWSIRPQDQSVNEVPMSAA
jgi:integrase